MNKLSEQEVDQTLIDNRKPLRRIIDDKIIPVAGLAAAGTVGTVKALSNIKRVNTLQPVK